MIFTKIKLENYGLFRGEHTLDLTPESKEKPIILFGGKNGAGKTTLFEAIRLCLYGNTFQGIPLPNTRYEKFLKERIHRYSGIVIQPDYASISLEFKYVQFGKVDLYLVKRYWRDNGSHINESLEIYKNAQLLSDVENSQWQDFVKELIPQGVTKLFFFDGEQIQNLAEDERNNIHLKDSFNSLLGLDVVERLQLDLRIMMSRLEKQSDEGTGKQLEELDEQKMNMKKELEALNTTKFRIQSQLDYLLGQVERQEQMIAKEGGGYASKRHELKDRKELLDKEIHIIEEQIREMSAGLLPFALTPECCIRLQQQILAEEEYQQQVNARKALDKKLVSLHDKLTSDELWDDIEINGESKLKLLDRITRSVEEIIQWSDIKKANIIHNLSGPEQQKLLGWINEVLNHISAHMKELAEQLEQLTRERQEVEKSLLRTPADEVIHPLVQELNKLHTEIGAEKQKLAQVEETIRSKEFKLTEVQRQIDKIYERDKKLLKLSEKQEFVEKTQLLLNEYLLRIREEKLKELADNLLASLNHLSHKKMFEKVVIEPKNFSVTLYQTNGDAIPKEQLSAGEKQIYAIAMLWALARTSRRALPFIIDTPLARLDSDHRLNLVSNFFPYAGHQVIIFSTDTEIDKKYFDELQPYISKPYHLEYDGKEGMTKESEGYFWKSKQEVTV